MVVSAKPILNYINCGWQGPVIEYSLTVCIINMIFPNVLFAIAFLTLDFCPI